MGDKYPRKEFVHASYSESTETNSDIVAVKEKLHYEDGTIVPNLRLIKDMERTYGITKKDYRDHEDKKEYEHLHKLDVYSSKQCDLANSVFANLHGFAPKRRLYARDVFSSPYVYGTNVSTITIAAKKYMDIEPNLVSPATLGVLDYETDVVKGNGDIISGALTYGKNIQLSVLRDFIGYISQEELEEKVNREARKLVGDILDRRGIERISLEIQDHPALVAKSLVKRMHMWKPDYVGIWSAGFDMGKMLIAFEKYGMNPKNIFSDPSIPSEYKHFKFKEDKIRKESISGKVLIKGRADLWHTMDFPASFKFVDCMSLFKLLRVREGRRASYALDAITKEEIGIGKLEYEPAAKYSGLQWHVVMQKHHKIPYLVYNAVDCILVEMLDETTGDVRDRLRPYIRYSEIHNADKNPKRVSDETHFGFLDDNKMIASVGRTMVSDLDALTPPTGYTEKYPYGWILTLSPELVHEIGLNVLEDHPNIHTNICPHTLDTDVSGAYPTGEIILNLSVSTRLLEVCSMVGVDEYDRRVMGMNLSNVDNNSIEIATKMYDFPSLDTLLTDYTTEK